MSGKNTPNTTDSDVTLSRDLALDACNHLDALYSVLAGDMEVAGYPDSFLNDIEECAAALEAACAEADEDSGGERESVEQDVETVEVPFRRIVEEFTDQNYDWTGPETSTAHIIAFDGRVASLTFEDEAQAPSVEWFREEYLDWAADPDRRE